MKVKDLIEQLKEMDPEANVYTYNEDHGFYEDTSAPSVLEIDDDEYIEENGLEFPAITIGL